MSEAKPHAVYYHGKVQIIEWSERGRTESWPLRCMNCGYTTADYWEKTQDFVHLDEVGDGDTTIPLCGTQCQREWAGSS